MFSFCLRPRRSRTHAKVRRTFGTAGFGRKINLDLNNPAGTWVNQNGSSLNDYIAVLNVRDFVQLDCVGQSGANLELNTGKLSDAIGFFFTYSPITVSCSG